jgi:hypothetical protein
VLIPGPVGLMIRFQVTPAPLPVVTACRAKIPAGVCVPMTNVPGFALLLNADPSLIETTHYDADPTIGNSRSDSAPHIYARPEVRAGVARLAAHGLALDAWCYHPQLIDVIALTRAVPQATIAMCHVGGVLGYGALADRIAYARKPAAAGADQCLEHRLTLRSARFRRPRRALSRASRSSSIVLNPAQAYWTMCGQHDRDQKVPAT